MLYVHVFVHKEDNTLFIEHVEETTTNVDRQRIGTFFHTR